MTLPFTAVEVKYVLEVQLLAIGGLAWLCLRLLWRSRKRHEASRQDSDRGDA
ncbi:MAG: hypothetical protein ACYDDF_05275 [Thermoplasmatota archaeon]